MNIRNSIAKLFIVNIVFEGTVLQCYLNQFWTLIKNIINVLQAKHGLCCTFTGHGVKKLISLQVSEGGEAAGAPEGGAAGGVSFVCLNAPSHVIQFILYHIDQYP